MKKKLTKDEIAKIIRDNWGKIPHREIGKLCGLSAEATRSRGKRMKLPPLEVGHNIYNRDKPVTIEGIVAERAKRDSLKEEKSKVSLLVQRSVELEKELQASLEMKKAINPIGIELPPVNDKGEAVAVVLASDFHLEETVRPDTVNNLNNFNLEIAERRTKEFFQNTLKLVQKEQHSTKIETLVLALLGDFISGNIHEELLENCSLRPIEAIIFAENLLIGGIEYLLENSDLKLIIPCSVGNHTRITKKIHVATERGNSLETFMYHHIKNHFKGNPRITFHINDSYLFYLQVYNYTLCFHHGHAIKYGGGIGGLTIPARKAISQWQKLRHADLHCFGHFHSFFDGGNFICNGSLIGWNTFAIMIKGDYDKPKQAFFLIDKKRNAKTVTCPIMFSV